MIVAGVETSIVHNDELPVLSNHGVLSGTYGVANQLTRISIVNREHDCVAFQEYIAQIAQSINRACSIVHFWNTRLGTRRYLHRANQRHYLSAGWHVSTTETLSVAIRAFTTIAEITTANHNIHALVLGIPDHQDIAQHITGLLGSFAATHYQYYFDEQALAYIETHQLVVLTPYHAHVGYAGYVCVGPAPLLHTVLGLLATASAIYRDGDAAMAWR